MFAQVITQVAEFLELEDDAPPELPPVELAARCDHFLETAGRLVRAMPDSELTNELPDRPRAWRELMHHVFQIPAAFLDMEESGEALTYENLVAPPPDDLETSADIADFGSDVQARFNAWWENAKDGDFSGTVPTYFGDTTRHEMLERTVWHTGQHVRQVASLLEQAGITPDGPLSARDICGLPLTEAIWDQSA